MTKEAFMARYDVSKRRMESWLKKGWIRGARILEDKSWYIPESAIPPYAARNIKCAQGVGMYASLLSGCAKGLDVFPALYGMHENRFDFYMEQLIKMEFVAKREIEGVCYYMPLPKCAEYHTLPVREASKFLKNALETLVEAGAKGMVSAILDAS